jgi:hypothetical protein
VIVKDTGKIAWRLQLGSAFIPSFILGCGIWFCPESPRWLMKHGKYAKGFRSMVRLRAHPIIAAKDYYYSHVIYQEELREARGAGYFSRLWDCFAVPRIRRANYGASTVMIAQQMCGINSKQTPWITLVLRLLTGLQSSPSTAPPSSRTWDTRLRRRYTHPWATVQSKSSPRFRRCSSLTPRGGVPLH